MIGCARSAADKVLEVKPLSKDILVSTSSSKYVQMYSQIPEKVNNKELNLGFKMIYLA